MDALTVSATVSDPSNPMMIRLRDRAASFQARVNGLTIVTEEDAKAAGTILVEIANFKKDWTLLFAPMVDKAKAAERAAKESRQEVEKTRDAVLDTVKSVDESLRGMVANALAKIETDARRARELAEAEALESAAADRKLEAFHLKQLAEKTGDKHYAKAAEEVEKAPLRAAVVPGAAPVKVAGVTHRVEVSVRLKSLRKLLVAVYKNQVDIDAIQWNEKWLRKEAEQRGEAFDIPGVDRVTTNDLTVRSTR
jgi:hypothetical protein